MPPGSHEPQEVQARGTSADRASGSMRGQILRPMIWRVGGLFPPIHQLGARLDRKEGLLHHGLRPHLSERDAVTCWNRADKGDCQPRYR